MKSVERTLNFNNGFRCKITIFTRADKYLKLRGSLTPAPVDNNDVVMKRQLDVKLKKKEKTSVRRSWKTIKHV